MSSLPFPFGGSAFRRQPQEQGIEYVLIRPVLQRVFAFADVTIDDVVNDPIARNKVRGYYKLHRQVERGIEVADLERQWNPNRILG